MDPRFPNLTSTLEISGSQLGGTQPVDITETWRDWISGNITQEMLNQSGWRYVRWADSGGSGLSEPSQEVLDTLALIDNPAYQYAVVQLHNSGSSSKDIVYIHIAGTSKDIPMRYTGEVKRWRLDSIGTVDSTYQIILESFRAPGFGPMYLQVAARQGLAYSGQVSGGTSRPYYQLFENGWDNIEYPSDWVGPPIPGPTPEAGKVEVFNGTEFVSAPVQVFDGSDWVDTEVLQWTGTQWQ